MYSRKIINNDNGYWQTTCTHVHVTSKGEHVHDCCTCIYTCICIYTCKCILYINIYIYYI